MDVYEILPIGFDGSNDKMDHLVQWVRGSYDEVVDYAIANNLDVQSISPIMEDIDDSVLDAIL